MIPYQNGIYFDSLYSAIQNYFPDIGEDESRDIIRELILSPQDDSIEINGQLYRKAELIAVLQRYICNEDNTSSFEERYNNLLTKTLTTIKNMNDGYITQEDYAERQNFLDMINRKEFEIYALHALLKSCGELNDPEQEAKLIYQVKSLRELGDLIRFYTKDAVDVKTGVQEYEKAKIIYKMIKSLQSLGYGYTISQKEKENLGISHEYDEDLNEDYAYELWIIRLMLLQLRRETRPIGNVYANNINAMFTTNLEDRSTLLSDIGGRISELRGTLHKRRFDSDRYNMLETNQENKNKSF